MLKMARICAIALAGALALSSPAVAQETETVDRTASIRAGGELKIKNFSGKVTVTGSRRGDIAIHAVRRGSRDRLDHIKLEVLETGSGVTIEANKKDSEWRERDNNVVETELDIQVPQDVQLDINVFSSDVIVSSVTGRQKVKTFSGNIEVSGATGSVDAETFSGDIQLGLAQGAGGSVEFDSFSGDLRAAGGMTTQSVSKQRVTGQVGTGGANNYKFKTFSGDVRIR